MKYGVFVWHVDPRYHVDDAVKLFNNEKIAQKFADTNIDKNYVVRSLAYVQTGKRNVTQNPLAHGYSRETIARNISKLRAEGIPEDRAIAAAFREARKWFEHYNPGASMLHYLRAPNPVRDTDEPTFFDPKLARKQLIERGKQRYSSFMLRAPDRSRTLNIPALPKVALAIGELSAIEYVSTRGGERVNYRHVFKKGSRPLLASSHDGKQLILLGGAYRFSNRGIIDRSD